MYNLQDRLVVSTVPVERILQVKNKGTLLKEPLPCQNHKILLGWMYENHFPGFLVGLELVPVDWWAGRKCYLKGLSYRETVTLCKITKY
jgi:hypothetical protein